MNLIDEDRRKIVEWAGRHPEIKAVHLYGSRARGDNTPDSDIDLALEMNLEPGDENALAVWVFWYNKWKESPDLHLSHKEHLEWYDKDDSKLKVTRAVKKDGILLYSE